MTAVSLRGYCRTDSERIDCTPAIRMTRLTTIARTGRRTKRSVNDFTLAVLRLRAPGCCRAGTALLTWTAAPLRSLKTPEVTTVSPDLTPEDTATWSPREAPILTNCWRTPR